MTIPNTHCVELSNTITTIRDKSNPLYSKTYCACTTIQLPYNTTINHQNVSVIAGPCSIESEDQIMATAHFVKKAGATILRGGAFKPRTSPYAFQGLGIEGLKLLKKAGDYYAMPVVTEILDSEDIAMVSQYADILQVGARNCQNFSLLKKLGKIQKPILLKRGMMVTIKEYLMAAEYILAEGNTNVILCERGIRTFETETRNTLDISAVCVLKQKTHLPVMVDPSHASGNWKLIHPLSLAAIAAGADGLMIECHINPEVALCDGEQSLRPDKFELLMHDVKELCTMLNKSVL
ncbi:MAG TPA: 3-deoxy-7-phosphoheptulonate synthase [Spirochaetota bacterium]|nr:3-deoxy-7-phosphoheptulonate synthase [Spirochaetota bacterium]